MPAKAGIQLSRNFLFSGFHRADDRDHLLVLALDPLVAIDAKGELSLPKQVRSIVLDGTTVRF